MTTIYYAADKCAAGKSYRQQQTIATTPGLHLMAVDRREMAPQVIQNLQQHAIEADTQPVIWSILSARDGEGNSTRVRVDVEALPTTYTDGHVIVIVTHEALRMSDLSGFRGWNLWIDETPSAFFRQEMRTHALGSRWFEERYQLRPDADGRKFAQVEPYADAPRYQDVMTDDAIRGLDMLCRRIETRRAPVFADLSNWSQMDDSAVVWTWHSLWLPNDLEAFERVEIVANGFEDSITFKIWQDRCPRIRFVPLPPLPARPFETRDVEIRYFAEDHRASATLWDRDEGKAYHAAIDAWLKPNVDPDRHIWTTNRSIENRFDMPGARLTPRQAGTNAHGHKTQATMIYSAKPSATEQAIMATMGITAADVVKARETEDLVQFVNRIGRNPSCTDALTVTVYDRQQALALESYFESVGHFRVTLVLIDLGYATYTTDRGGRPRKTFTPAEAAIERERKKQVERDRKRRQRAAKKAA